jgi:hypothetical protein
MIRIPGLALVLAALLLNAAAAHAHTLAGTMISVAVTRPGIVTITIAAEADPLIVELETLAGTPASEPPMTSDERRARIESLLPTLLTNVEASIARQRLVLEIQDVTVDDTAQTEIRVHGRMPPGPTTFTWRSTFIFGAYRITIIGRAGEVIEWLQGAQTSTPIALEARPADDERSALRLTGNRIGHSLAMSALVVYVLCRRRAAQKLSGRKQRSR